MLAQPWTTFGNSVIDSNTTISVQRLALASQRWEQGSRVLLYPVLHPIQAAISRPISTKPVMADKTKHKPVAQLTEGMPYSSAPCQAHPQAKINLASKLGY
jgi:hypothetical protein